jgi:hypothetical protein
MPERKHSELTDLAVIDEEGGVRTVVLDVPGEDFRESEHHSMAVVLESSPALGAHGPTDQHHPEHDQRYHQR